MNQTQHGTDGVLHKAPSVQSLRFELAIRRHLGILPGHGTMGVGTLSEKRMHAIIKHFLCEDEKYHEIPLNEKREKGDRKYIADVLVGNEAYEVQTGSFSALRDKVRYYLEKTDYHVTLVHPLVRKRYINWMDPKTGDILKRNRSPRSESLKDIIPELWFIREHLSDPRLSVCVLILDADEFRFKDGWDRTGKRGSTKYDRIPTELVETVIFDKPEDYLRLLSKIPEELFSVKDLSSLCGIYGTYAYGFAGTLEALGLIEKAEMKGRAQGYRMKK